MLYPAMSKLIERVPNRYLLVNVVARRARQLADIADELGEPVDNKPVTSALNEIADGKITAANVDITIRR